MDELQPQKISPVSRPTGLPECVVFYDGVCNLCDFFVNFCIDRNQNRANLYFAPLNGALSRELLGASVCDGYRNHPETASVVYWRRGEVFTESSAALEICRELDGWYPYLGAFRVVPAWIRNFVYRWVAQNRYRFFGKQNACRMPSPDRTNRFLEIRENELM